VIRATKCTLANQYFVARTTRAATRATFLPYSQRFVARTTTAAMNVTKRWLPTQQEVDVIIDRSLTICQAAHMRTPEGDAATQVILATFRANGVLLAAGEAIAREEGLTAARWQVLGALALEGRPLTVPQIARRMGLTRQSVHATVDRLLDAGLVERVANADHRRSQLVRPTTAGERTYEAVSARQARWVDALADGLGRRQLETTATVLAALSARLENDEGGRDGT
jgi:DNA-binding MarR family transcriptional regulator